ncbi:MAG TPA: DEAD/DEAH box helicase [Stellaceae bacterium]|nr:DEAD/DEAH box helicase [Stellaceae bacterium]
MLRAAAREGRSALLVAPTGGGKTLAGFPPSLVALTERPQDGLHTLYISPLKAWAVDIHRNLERPLAELDLPIRIETRTGDTPALKRQRQREHPPQMLMTTPESLALLLSYPEARRIFRWAQGGGHRRVECSGGDQARRSAWRRRRAGSASPRPSPGPMRSPPISAPMSCA